MKNQTAAKIALLLSGVMARLAENFAFFKQIDIVFRSGRRTFSATVTAQAEDSFLIRYNGTQRQTNRDGISAFVTAECVKYDEVQVTYQERGAQIVVEGSDRGVKTRQMDAADSAAAPQKLQNTGARDYIIKVGQADALLKEIGILSAEGKLKNDMLRKYSQIDHYIELVAPLVDALPNDRCVTVLDCACGKSYLSFVLNYYMRDMRKMNCRFIGIDYNKDVIASSQKMARNLGYHNMEFLCADLNAYVPDKPIDMLVSLHACDTATDMALGLGIRSGVGAIVCVPCCHKEMLSQYACEPFNALLKFPVFKARLADDLTDAMRALYLEARGYEVTALEYISPLETPKNLMIKAVKRSAGNKKAMEEYQRLCEFLHVRLSVEAYAQPLTEE